jgi:hypothetical protein
MPRKPTKPDDSEQSKRFLKTAEEVGADADDEALERAFKKIGLQKKTATSDTQHRSQRSSKAGRSEQ